MVTTQKPSCYLVIRDLNIYTTEEQLIELFRQYALVKNACPNARTSIATTTADSITFTVTATATTHLGWLLKWWCIVIIIVSICSDKMMIMTVILLLLVLLPPQFLSRIPLPQATTSTTTSTVTTPVISTIPDTVTSGTITTTAITTACYTINSLQLHLQHSCLQERYAYFVDVNLHQQNNYYAMKKRVSCMQKT